VRVDNVTRRFWRETKRDPSTAVGMTMNGKRKSEKAKTERQTRRRNGKSDFLLYWLLAEAELAAVLMRLRLRCEGGRQLFEREWD
jgi:hypothetical protein